MRTRPAAQSYLPQRLFRHQQSRSLPFHKTHSSVSTTSRDRQGNLPTTEFTQGLEEIRTTWKMDQRQYPTWRKPREELSRDSRPPLPNEPNPFGMDYSTSFPLSEAVSAPQAPNFFNPAPRPPSFSSPLYSQPWPSRWDGSANSQNDDRGRAQGAFTQQAGWPSQQQNAGRDQDQEGDEEPTRRKRGRGKKQQPKGERRPRRAPAPEWHFVDKPIPQRQPLTFPMANPALGPFTPSQPFQQNYNPTAASFPTQQIPGLAPSTFTPRPSDPTTRPVGGSGRSGSSDAITPPSAASGGIPTPTPYYLTRAHYPPFRSPHPRPLLVVIDLNGTLLHRPNKRAAHRFVERPGARAFLQHCVSQYTVAIWSSARPANVQAMCAQLLSPEDLSRVVAVWGRDRFGLTAVDYGRRTQCYKRLTRLWGDEGVRGAHPFAKGQLQSQPPSSPFGKPGGGVAGWGGGGGVGGGVGGVGGSDGPPSLWDQSNTVLIDDSAEKARSEPHNAITLPEFAGDMAEDPPVLALVQEYLAALAWQVDVSTYMRVQPFVVAKRETVPAAVEGQS